MLNVSLPQRRALTELYSRSLKDPWSDEDSGFGLVVELWLDLITGYHLKEGKKGGDFVCLYIFKLRDG